MWEISRLVPVLPLPVLRHVRATWGYWWEDEAHLEALVAYLQAVEGGT